MVLLVLNMGLLLWRLLAIGEAGLTPTGAGSRSRATTAVVVLLMLLTMGMHTWLATATLAADRALAQIFNPPVGTDLRAAEASATSTPAVPVYRWDGTERVNILLIGYDSGPGRVDENTDTLMVATIDPVTRTAALVSVPRDTGYVPLPDRRIYADGLFPRRVNELASAANADPGAVVPGPGGRRQTAG